MDRFNSSSRLLPKIEDEESNEAFMTEDSSSGYDSSDSSDSESESCRDSRQENTNRRRENETTLEIMKVRSMNALSEDLKMIMTLPEMCDVTFLVGPQEVPVYGVRAILSMRSRVFYQLILKYIQMAAVQKKSRRGDGCSRFSSERIVIPVRKYDPKVFRMLIEFLHSGVVNITTETVPGLLCGADQFQLDDLSMACWEFIDKSLVAGKAQDLLGHTRKYNHHKTAKKIFDKPYVRYFINIKENGTRICTPLRAKSFLSIRFRVPKLLEMQSLGIPRISVETRIAVT